MLLLLLLSLVGLLHDVTAAAHCSKMNIQYLMADDMRPELQPWANGDWSFNIAPDIQTPNINNLAESGTTFLRAYCQQAVCGPRSVSNFVRVIISLEHFLWL